jgi:hypothetical protein
MIIVGMQVQWLTRWRLISRPASSRSQRGMMTTVLPASTGEITPYSMPVMWNMGTTPRLTVSALACPHSAPPMALGISVRWLCTQPLGRPVVPEV